MTDEFKDKTIVITGGAGSIGSALVRHLLGWEPKQIRVLSIDENRQYFLREELNHPKNLSLLLGNIRDKKRLDMAFQGADIVFHAAALKHVPLCEYNPFEAVKTNIVGSQNVIESALENNVKKVIAISTDKAVNPINIMGTTKLMMERLFINANYYIGKSETKFSCVRFGNVAWSEGSVLPLWQKQAKAQKTIRVTDKEMTRFLISEDQAIKLILKATELSQGGEIFILKMPSVKLGDLAEMFLAKYFPGEEIRIEIIGQRDGEKTDEELFNTKEKYRELLENEEMFIAVPNLFIYNLEREEKIYPGFTKAALKDYSSKDALNKAKIQEII